jgi:hypothetical protein
MPSQLDSVSFLLFSSDAFWSNTNLNTLGMLQNTCSQFRNEIMELPVQKTKQGKRETLLVHAVHVIVSSAQDDEWTTPKVISVHEAMRRFMLTMPAVVKHLRTLPEDDPFFLKKGERCYKDVMHIPFLHAFDLAVQRKGSLKLVKTLKEKANIVKMQKLEEMTAITQRLTAEAESGCEAMTKGVVGALAKIEENGMPHKFKNRVTILESIAQDISIVERKVKWVNKMLESPVHKNNLVAIHESSHLLRNNTSKLIYRFVNNKWIKEVTPKDDMHKVQILLRMCRG